MRQMTLVAFLQAQNCTNFPSSWRHPLSRTDTWSADYYRHIGRVLEEGKFHLGFFDDRLSMPDIYGNDHGHTVKHGIRCVKLDAVTVLTVMGMATERLGLGATYSTSYYQPFHVARVFATLDLMTAGRAAWNVVTSLNDGEARNMGRDHVTAHDERYDRADEFMAVVLGHWDSWQDGAVVQDKSTGLFAHPDRVRRLDHEGRFFRSRGPFTVPRSPQGHPVIIQAGQSGRGRRFGARWGELIFVVYPNLAAGKRDYTEFKIGGRAMRPRSRPCRHHSARQHRIRRHQGRSRGQVGDHRQAAAGDRCAVAALGGAQLRLCYQSHGRGLHGSGDGGNFRAAGDSRSGGARQRQEQSDGPRFHAFQRPRPGARSRGRWPPRHRRPARAMVRRACL